MSFLEKARIRPPARTAYGEKALTEELERVQTAAQGSRNDTLNRAAFSLGQLVGGSVLDESETSQALYAAAMSVGLEHQESVDTIRSGITDGKLEPRAPEIRDSSRPAVAQVVEIPQQRTRAHLRDRLLDIDGLGNLPPATPLVDGLLYRGTLAQIAGQPGSYKSFLTIGMACSVALGRDWEGHRVPAGGPVVYVAPEGASGLRGRVLAWCDLNDVDQCELKGKLLFLPEALYLKNVADVTEAVEVAADIKALLLVLDTRARCTLGLEENSSTEQGVAIDAAERIQRASGATVLGVHHSGRGGDHGRGSNAWDGAVWSDLRLSGEDLRARLHCEKHKDVPDGCDHHYRLVPHVVSPDLMPGCDEQQRSTLVVVQSGALDDLAGDSRTSRTVLDVVRTSAGNEGLTRSQIVELAGERFNVSRSSVYSAVNVLVKAAAIRNVGTAKRARYVLANEVLS